MANKLLRVMSVDSAREWHDIVTFDESCVSLRSDHDLMRMGPGPQKLLLRVVWIFSGF
jgi:hypothetical protein